MILKKKFFQKKKLDQIENYLENNKKKKYPKFTKFYNLKYKRLRKEIIKEYTKKLNLVHCKNYKPVEWQVLIGPWLDKSLSIYLFYSYFFKGNKFKLFFKNYKKKYKIKIPEDYNEFLKLVNQKEFYPYFIACMKFDFTDIEDVNEIELRTKLNWKMYFLKFVNFFHKKKVYLSNSRFGNKNLLKIFLYSFFKIIPIPNLHNNLSIRYLSEKSTLREKFCLSFEKKNKNYNILKVLNNILPKSYLEYFKNLNSLGSSIIKMPKKIYTDTTYIDDELLKIQIADWKNKGFKNLILAQHGGNYKIYNKNYLGSHEHDISDTYIDWSNKNKKGLKNLTSIRLNFFLEKNKKYSDIKKKYSICFVLRPLRKTNFQSVFFESYLYKQDIRQISQFLNSLGTNYVVKYYPELRYPDQLTIEEISKELKIPFEKLKTSNDFIFKSNIIIFNYISTMLFEILAFNIPFLLIIDDKNHCLSNYGKNFVKDLKKVNLFHSNYQSALKFLHNKKNLSSWWLDDKIQSEIKLLKKKYGNTNNNYVNDWYKYFIK